jgi:hypothetical protein
MITKRLIDRESDADQIEREVLRSGIDLVPPAGAEGDVWRKLLGAIAPPSTPDGGGGSTLPDGAALAGAGAAAKAVSTIGTLAKGFLAGVGASAVVAGGIRVLSPAAEERRATPVSESLREIVPPPDAAPRSPSAMRLREPASAPATSPRRAVPGRAAAPQPSRDRGEPSRSPVPASSVAAFPVLEASLGAGQLEEEARMLARARAELLRSEFTAAFATLEASRLRFSSPELYQEREALTIELLYRSGERRAAAERGGAFLERFPDSPHVARVRGFSSAAEIRR